MTVTRLLVLLTLSAVLALSGCAGRAVGPSPRPAPAAARAEVAAQRRSASEQEIASYEKRERQNGDLEHFKGGSKALMITSLVIITILAITLALTL